MDSASNARETFLKGFTCSQAIVLTFADQVGLDKNTALKFSSGFGGGIGRTGHVCGAVSGAVCVLGMQYGFTDASDADAKNIIYAKIQEFQKRFQAKHNTLICTDLIGHDISNPQDRAKAMEKNIFKTFCPDFVETAASILVEMLNEE